MFVGAHYKHLGVQRGTGLRSPHVSALSVRISNTIIPTRSDHPRSDPYGQRPPGATPSPPAVANSDSADGLARITTITLTIPTLALSLLPILSGTNPNPPSTSTPAPAPALIANIPLPTTSWAHPQDLRPTSPSSAPPRMRNAPSDPRPRRSPRFLPPRALPRAVRDPPKHLMQRRRYLQLSARQTPNAPRSSCVVCRPSYRAWYGTWRRCCAPMSKAHPAPAAAVMALMVMGTTARSASRPCGTGGDTKEEREVEREVCAQDEGEAMDVDETDNEDTGADAEDEEMASWEEQRDAGVVRERILETCTPAASAPAPRSTPPTGTNPTTTKIKRKAARPAPQTRGHLFHAGCLGPWFRSHTTCLTCRFDIDPKSLTLLMPPPTKRGGPTERARE